MKNNIENELRREIIKTQKRAKYVKSLSIIIYAFLVFMAVFYLYKAYYIENAKPIPLITLFVGFGIILYGAYKIFFDWRNVESKTKKNPITPTKRSIQIQKKTKQKNM
ncbi:MAG: hypothetical protein LBE36_10020 [Flavobacteriaceae bacterium]|nr:hypothetical protein [Flavobacteriaceae bacterium]